MATRKTTESRLDEFIAACETANGETLSALVGKALGDRHYRLISNAAGVCGERLLYALEQDLVTAYQRLLGNPVKKDPHCIAKGAIVRALVKLDCQDHEFFLAGMRYRQLEPTWGGSVDTALDLRNSSAMGLVGTSYDRAAVAIAELMCDPEAYVRAGALRALACVREDRAEPLLRLKALSGDPDTEVIGECFASLLQLDPDETFEFVAGFLDGADQEIAQYAALALGESRQPAALKALCAAFDQVYVEREFRRILIRAVVLQRSEPAYAWLLDVAAERDADTCELVIEELSIYQTNSKLQARLAQALAARGDDALVRSFLEVWGAAAP